MSKSLALKPAHKIVAGGACIIAACVPFTAGWEGTDLVAKRDMIGTGHPITYCHGETAPGVKAGDVFKPAQCDSLLAKSLPKYLTPLEACIHVELPVKTEAALLDAAYNAGPAAVCRSTMLAKMNAGDLRAGCEAFSTWYVRASGVVVKGLQNRRKGDRQLCLEGVAEGLPKPAAEAPTGFMALLGRLFNLIFEGN